MTGNGRYISHKSKCIISTGNTNRTVCSFFQEPVFKIGIECWVDELISLGKKTKQSLYTFFSTELTPIKAPIILFE